jgi:hypothetical protein
VSAKLAPQAALQSVHKHQACRCLPLPALLSLQAANIQEALEVGANTLLVDEDTSATNFMIRDARMQASGWQ